MKSMKENIEFLKKDRSANSKAFEKRLNNIGIGINYGEFGYWNHEPYVEIGDTRVYLVEIYYCNNSLCIKYRSQNEVIRDIMEAIDHEVRMAERDDLTVENFFKKYEKVND